MQNTQDLDLSSETVTFTYATNTTGVALGTAKGLGIFLAITNVAPSAGAFTASVTNLCTKSSHGFLTGLKVQVSSTTTLPAGLSGSTDYFVIKVDANTFKLASSLVNAQAGTEIDITDAGTGTHTITPTALAGATYQVEGSMDNSSWAVIGAAVNITATANALIEKVDPMYRYVRVAFAITAGQLSVVQSILAKG